MHMLTIFQVSNDKRSMTPQIFPIPVKINCVFNLLFFWTLAWEGLEFKAIIKVLLDCPNLQLNFFKGVW